MGRPTSLQARAAAAAARSAVVARLSRSASDLGLGGDLTEHHHHASLGASLYAKKKQQRERKAHARNDSEHAPRVPPTANCAEREWRDLRLLRCRSTVIVRSFLVCCMYWMRSRD